jgi:RHS repeat-associated protein
MSYNYFRDYDSQTGRYLEADPTGLRGGINTYANAAGNPLTYFDPFGLDIMVITRRR